MVSRVTEITTSDGEITIGDLIRYLLTTPEFKSRQLSELFLSVTNHDHDVESLTNIDKFVKSEDFNNKLSSALSDLEKRLDSSQIINEIKKQIQGIESTPVPVFDASKIEKRLAKLEVKANAPTVASPIIINSKSNKEDLKKIEYNQSQIIGVIDNIIDNQNVKLDELRKEIMAEVVKKVQKLGNQVNIVGGVGSAITQGSLLKVVRPVTVGVSDGAFRTDDYGGNPALAFAAALATSSAITVLPGTYTWTEPLEYEPDVPVDIQGIGSPNFIIAHSGAVAVANITTLGDFNMEGIKFQIDTWVASQKIVNIAPPASAFQTVNNRVKCTFVYGTGVEDDFAPTFSPGNEMIGVLITQGKGCIIEGNIVYPNKGVVAGRCKNGFGNIVRNNRVQNGSLFYFPTIGDPQRRPCYMGFHFENETAPIHHDNIYENLGLIDALTGRVDRRLAHAVLFQIPNVAKGTYEYGHEVTRDNTYRDCLTDTTCVADYRGIRWLLMTGEYFCFNGTATATGAGFVRITDANADGTGTNAYAYQSQIVGNHFHNPGTSGAAAIYINSATNLAIQSNIFHELYCAAPIVVDPKTSSDNVGTLTIQGNKASWPTSAPNTRHFINRIGTDANAAKKLYLDGNICESSDASYPVSGFYNGTAFATVHEVQEEDISKPPIEVVRNKTYVILQKATYSGRITETTTKCLSGTCTATFYINGVALGGTANSVSSSEQSQSHTSANEFVAGDTVSMIVTSNSACLDLAYTVKAVRGLI